MPIVLVIVGLTVVMGYFGRKVEITYQWAKLLPDSDSVSVDYEYFKKHFGQDGSVLVVGTELKALKKLENFNAWYDLGDKIKTIPGIEGVLSVPRINDLILNDSLGRFDFQKLFTERPKTQEELNVAWERIEQLKFYHGILYNPKANSTLMAITFSKKDLNTKNRLAITDSIKSYATAFANNTGNEIHFSGLPYIRTNVARKIQNEMTFFMLVAIGVTGLILFLFFRSFYVVVFSMIVVMMGVVWSLGSIVLFGYKLSVLSGLIPPLIIVIGVPNCILILNKYQTEFARHGNKIKALHTAIDRISNSLFFANFTTAIGFAVFCAIENKILFEFGLVASLNVMATYIISLMLVPIIFSYLPAPSTKHLKHLDGKSLRKILQSVDKWTRQNRKLVYISVIILAIISAYGVTRIKAVGFVVDDLPKNDPVLTDLHYFEKNYGGVLPFEITVDTKRENGVFINNARALYRINKLQKILVRYPELSRPLSVVEGVKFFYQSYKGGDSAFYRLPSVTELKKVADYVQNDERSKNSKNTNQLTAFIDSTRRITRISVQIADIGSVKIKELVNELKPRVDSAFNFDYEKNAWMQEYEKYDVKITGNSLMFLKGNDFLVSNLLESVVLAVILIAILMLTLFASLRMILISTIPSLVALLITAGVMGYLGIPLKPSTILVFSIAFGISSDGTLYFLTKYRHEIKRNRLSISDAVSLTIQETGVSMVYTAIVLFFGFGMFMLSSFGGTAALGILISFTLLIAYCSNLILLPAFLLSLEKRMLKKEILNIPLIEIDEEEEEDDKERF